jgi:hypothetical protein
LCRFNSVWTTGSFSSAIGQKTSQIQTDKFVPPSLLQKSEFPKSDHNVNMPFLSRAQRGPNPQSRRIWTSWFWIRGKWLQYDQFCTIDAICDASGAVLAIGD